MMNWTKQQADAIYDESGTLLISAAAGSGKTAVLVERAARLMLRDENPIPADKFLIVTFTRAAAAELRAKIGKRLALEQAKHPNNINIRRQRLLLGRANINTIDAFCMQLLKLYFAELSIPPDFTKADDALIASLRSEAISEALEKMYENEEFGRLAAMYGRSRSDDEIKDIVLNVYDFLRSAALPEKAARHILQMWYSTNSLVQSEWGQELLKNAELEASAALEIAIAAKNIAQENELEHYLPALESDITAVALMLDLIKNKRWNDALYAVQGYKAKTLSGKKGFAGSAVDTVKLLRDKVKKAIDKLGKGVFVCTEEEFCADRAAAAPLVSALLQATSEFEQIFFAKKLAEKALEYSDFEHLTRRLLCDENGAKTPEANAISSQFEVIMIDEYQDTNALQALLYSCLANADCSNMFMVGDVKQSIYRFRLAEPEIFVQKKDSYHALGEGSPALINLGHNFRSNESVVDQINYIFERIMNRALGGVDYTADEKLVAAGGKGIQSGEAEIKVILTNGKASAADADEIAKTIKQMVDSGYIVHDENGTRKCSYGDFCILLRTREPMLKYAIALEKMAIPSVADASGSVLQTPEVSALVSLLRVIDNPGQDVPLAAVLLSEMYSLSPEQLMELRGKSSLYSALSNAKAPQAKAAAEDLRYFRAVYANAPFDELIDAIMSRTNYFAAVSAMPEGAIRRENLRAFVSYACNTVLAVGGLSAFLRRLDASGDKIPELESAANISKTAVNIMTIHKSKGLEFKICILANTQHSFRIDVSRKKVLLHQRLGLGLLLREGSGSLYNTLAFRALAYAEQSETVSEEMRILYVALTRAREKLIITMAKKDKEEYSGDEGENKSLAFLQSIAVPLICGGAAYKSFLQNAPDASVWLCAALMLHPACTQLRAVKMAYKVPVEHGAGALFSAQIINAQEVTDTENKPKQRTAIPDNALVQELREGFLYAAEHKTREIVPVKVSVSALAKHEARETLSRPSFVFAQGLTAAEKGTAMHSFLQFANFSAARQNIKKEQERLCAEGYILPEIMEKLDTAAIAQFLHSPLMDRIIKAEKVYREYDFITDISQIKAHQEKFLVQGIADLVIISNNSIEIVDYKTDKGKTKAQLIESYQEQLSLYSAAVSKRLGLPVIKLTIYSFNLLCEIDVLQGKS